MRPAGTVDPEKSEQPTVVPPQQIADLVGLAAVQISPLELQAAAVGGNDTALEGGYRLERRGAQSCCLLDHYRRP